MPHAKRTPNHRPRELRRRVVLPARLRSANGWADACILNVSSRGLLVQSARTGPTGSEVELWRGEHVIVARVVWRDGARAGLCSEDQVPVADILSLNRSAALQLTAGGGTRWKDRRRRVRSEDERRAQGQIIQFAGVFAIAVALSALTYHVAEQALARPLALVSAALGG